MPRRAVNRGHAATGDAARHRGVRAPYGVTKGEYRHENGMCIHHSRGETAHS